MQSWVTLALLLSFGVNRYLAQNGLGEPPVPRGLTLKPDLPAQTLSLTWQSDSWLFDLEVFHTELMNVVLNETVAVQTDPVTRMHSWTWHSPLPLECTSHSVRIRARNQQSVSQWSPLQTIPGWDIPKKSYMFPQDKMVPVGSNMTFCCIVNEKEDFKEMKYGRQEMNATRLSRRTYAITVTNQPASDNTGTNVICSSQKLQILTGAVVFVGYPPGDEGLVCETRDLASAECSWKKGRDTHLKIKRSHTNYTLNGRDCLEANERKTWCSSKIWEENWTLVARNPLGTVQLTDSAQLTDRVHLLAPVDVVAVKGEAWSVTLQWSWSVEAYKKLEMVCQLRLFAHELSSTRNYDGPGLSSVVLEGLWPDVDYTVTVRCGSKHGFWKWGDESAPYRIHTKMDRPDALDVWMWMDGSNTGRVFWKPLSVRESHGALVGYEVSQSSAEEDGWKMVSLPPGNFSYPIILNNSSDITVAVAARNPAGLSQPSTVTTPAYRADSQLSVSELLGTNGSFVLSWEPDVNASRGYAVEWVPTGCSGLCRVDWKKLPESASSFTVNSDCLVAGVRYTVSVYSLSTGAPTLLQRWQGYSQEMIPSQSVAELLLNQTGSDVLLSWKATEMKQHRGFIRGYTIYLANAAHLDLIANITDPAVQSYRVKGLSLSSYKFVVKAYTSAGEDGGATVAIKMEMDTADMLFVGILVPLGIMFCCLILVSICCYSKREWVKKSFYPEIPGPKVSGDWSSPRGPLDVKPSPHSLVHIVENPGWGFSKEGLFPVPEEEEESEKDNMEVDTDSDEPALLRYYKQVVDDSSHSNQVLDSSGSSTLSVGSTQTEITYAGIQNPIPSQGACAGGGYRPQLQSVEGPAEPQIEFEADFQDDGLNAGYKPQCSWQLDSPEAENLSGSLGSPTSVTSSQFLIPESSEEKPQPSNTWFHNFLSGKT
ncbi:leukemia inhibitory factor receptor-like isoform X1 [Carassius carassius]|uniref:leukemia inhibitory factor receptor-like isoform X1 n=1 Tax=Carassius carassius TaxID=217509 RepID=UPI002868A2AD|nr:leukemia inhibitory factor receptor-like isoform X1 [Carassius carassius]XP_059404778.1 leukemia inhibitory factor receptor-like isoform X1 [Carassius carassius]XP_059404779.1 leukemia inhibitory factor receptor-like isoform X1 [Carassius carassius]XP_059404780.1 leukemia inhibitory factor receptor-like isoform X1 [Carassius carassius]